MNHILEIFRSPREKTPCGRYSRRKGHASSSDMAARAQQCLTLLQQQSAQAQVLRASDLWGEDGPREVFGTSRN